MWAAYLTAKKAAEEAISESGLDWTILRPGQLTDEPGTGRVLLAPPPVERADVTRDDTAAVLVALLDTPTTAGPDPRTASGRHRHHSTRSAATAEVAHHGRVGRDEDAGNALEAAIRDLLATRAAAATICPSEAARKVALERGSAEEDAWRSLMEPARMAARRLVDRGEVEVLQGGRIVDPSTAKGPVRIRRAR